MHVSDSQAISTFKKKRKKRVLYLWRLKEALLLRYIWACQYSCFNSSPVRVYCVAKLERVWHEKNRFEFHASLTSRLHESQWSLWILVICVASVWCWKTNTRHIRVYTQLTCRTINFEKGVIFWIRAVRISAGSARHANGVRHLWAATCFPIQFAKVPWKILLIQGQNQPYTNSFLSAVVSSRLRWFNLNKEKKKKAKSTNLFDIQKGDSFFRHYSIIFVHWLWLNTTLYVHTGKKRGVYIYTFKRGHFLNFKGLRNGRYGHIAKR